MIRPLYGAKPGNHGFAPLFLFIDGKNAPANLCVSLDN